MDAPSAECIASALALTQRVRDLGLHVGDVVVTGLSIGLPNAETGRAVFDAANMDMVMRGDNMISALPEAMLQAQLDRNVVQVQKAPDGSRIRKPLNMVEEVIKLASRIGNFDLVAEYGLSPAIVETLDTTYALAVAAGLEALRNAGLVEAPTPPASALPAAASGSGGDWKLAREHRDETGVVFAASFPALDSLIDELSRAMAAAVSKGRVGARTQARGEWLRQLHEMATRGTEEAVAAGESANGHSDGGESAVRVSALRELQEWLAQQQLQQAEEEESAVAGGYEFNRKLLFKLLVMANSQLAELVQARGPNLQINAACAGTTAAIALACDWLRTGRCRRVVVISADNPSSDHMLPWVGIGFLALGAACTKPTITEAALPFDKRRCGMLLGAGAVGLVLETDSSAASSRPGFAKGRPPLATVWGVRQANSAYHASAIAVKHATEQLEALLKEIEIVHCINRRELASSLLYVSHETFTYARNGGCAGAEVTALRAAFGEDLRKVLITNSKGMTGHAMGVCFEDVVAIAALSSGLAPPIVNHRESDPVLGPLRLSPGGAHDCRYALHFAAGFGSQVTYVMYKKTG